MTSFTPVQTAAMRRALRAAASPDAPPGPNPRVGCVILSVDGNVLAEGHHRGAGTAHAEVDALANLAAAGASAQGATAVVTLEPCNHEGRTGPCVQALLAAGVAEVIYAQDDPTEQAGGGAAAPLPRGGFRLWFRDRLGPGFGFGGGFRPGGILFQDFLLGLRCTGLEHSGHHVGHHHGGSAAQLVSELREFGQQLPAGDPEMFGELMDSGTRGQLRGSGFLIGFGHVRLLRAHWRQLQRGSPRLSRLKVNRKHRSLRGRVHRRGVQPRAASRQHRRCLTW